MKTCAFVTLFIFMLDLVFGQTKENFTNSTYSSGDNFYDIQNLAHSYYLVNPDADEAI